MKKPNHEFASRLREALIACGVKPSPAVLGHEFNLRHWGEGISTHAARNWLSGVSIPKTDKLKTLAHWLNVTPESLLFGTEQRLAAEEIKAIYGTDSRVISDIDQQFLDNFLSLNKEGRHVLRMVTCAMRHHQSRR